MLETRLPQDIKSFSDCIVEAIENKTATLRIISGLGCIMVDILINNSKVKTLCAYVNMHNFMWPDATDPSIMACLDIGNNMFENELWTMIFDKNIYVEKKKEIVKIISDMAEEDCKIGKLKRGDIWIQPSNS